jgi:hypothetical protein
MLQPAEASFTQLAGDGTEGQDGERGHGQQRTHEEQQQQPSTETAPEQ